MERTASSVASPLISITCMPEAGLRVALPSFCARPK
jgi:hypothetical protein